jgi:predicted metal-dependent phosphoesterase TrpH
MLKADFHMHCLEDPRDYLSHTSYDLIDHAAKHGYQVLSITLHGKRFCPPELVEYAADKGILLIPGIEAYVDKVEVLLLGVSDEDLQGLRTMQHLAALREKKGDDLLVIAPHPFYSLPQCAGPWLEKVPDNFDAIEFCRFYTQYWDRNRIAKKVAEKIGKPMIACSDTHRLDWMHDHYCLLDAEQTKESVFAAIRAGKIQNVSAPLTYLQFAHRMYWYTCVSDPLRIARGWGWISAPKAKIKASQKKGKKEEAFSSGIS